MSEWLSGNLGDIADIVMGQSPTGESVNTNGLGVPLLNGPTEFTIRYPKAVQFSTDPKRFSKVNDILFCVRGSTTGRMNWADEDYAIGRGLAAIRHKQGEEYRYFVKAILDYYLDTMLASASGSTFPNVSKDQLNELEISYPSFPEQKAIASVLSSLDDKINLLHRQNKTLEAMAETLFRQWFIEDAKEDWLTVQVKDIVKQIKPGTNYQPKRLESGIPFLNVRNLKNGQIDLQGISFISQEEYERVHKAWKPEVGDVLISRIGTLGIVAVLGKRDMPMAVHYNMLVLKPNLTNTAFLYFLLRSQYFQDLYSSKARQSVQEYVAVEDAEAIELKLPLNDADFVKKQEQFSDLFNKIRANLAQIQTLEKLRDTLLPKLMSGEVRVQYQTEEVA
ncbi:MULTISPECIES: restriction endonuclease subunit S [Acinetobacter]|jgi:type I restriction enzyme S subunit|uniref:restriction endonuclease subunit S n=1 Tax=Acinetobacter TaxID=469 RepID=UPI00226ECA19|nr:restriction endonuclease subunit S [Acinetobacter baumannii]MCY0273968.1 restriction endonuclease subunit S [Acinetobacter baumannii]